MGLPTPETTRSLLQATGQLPTGPSCLLRLRQSVLEVSLGPFGKGMQSLSMSTSSLPGPPTEAGRHKKTSIQSPLRALLKLQSAFSPPAPYILASTLCSLLVPSAATLLACCLSGVPQPLCSEPIWAPDAAQLCTHWGPPGLESLFVRRQEIPPWLGYFPYSGARCGDGVGDT